MNQIDYNLYKIFLYVYDNKQISKVANMLYVSQPAISYSIKELERQLGYTLFYRNAKGVEPTLEAKELYYYISSAFNTIKMGEDHLKNLQDLNVGVIRIGTPSHIAIFYLSQFIYDFRKIYPGIRFEIISKSTADMVNMLETRTIDLIIDSLPIDSNKMKLEKTNLAKLCNCFAYSKENFSNCHIKTIKDLAKYPMILPSETSSIRKKLEEYLNANDTVLTPAVESWTTEFMLEMVRKGVGVGYFIENVILTQEDSNNFEVIKFDNSLPNVDVSLAYIHDFVTPSSKKFINFIKESEEK